MLYNSYMYHGRDKAVIEIATETYSSTTIKQKARICLAWKGWVSTIIDASKNGNMTDHCHII